MALRTLSALAKAIADVKKEAGDLAEHKDLLASLDGIKEHLGDSQPKAEPRDGEDDDYSFAQAEKRHVERSKASVGASSEAAPAAAGGEGK